MSEETSENVPVVRSSSTTVGGLNEARLEEVRTRPGIVRADELIRSFEEVTDLQIERARRSDKVPRWTDPFLVELLEFTVLRYAGVERARRAHVFVFRGVTFVGVYDAASPWVASFGDGFREEVESRDLAESTVATMLGAICEALLGGRVVRRYFRSGSRDDEALELDL